MSKLMAIDHRERDLDPLIWKACSGNLVQVPTVGSRVYYFPQGHAEHCASQPDVSSLGFVKPVVLCRIVSVRLLANLDTDEVYAKIRLQPVDRPVGGVKSASLDSEGKEEEEEAVDWSDEGKFVSFAKVLTASDANNGGGFSVPRFCAEAIFPHLDFEKEPPVQTIVVRDIHGVTWEFRHIFRGTPRRHLLTTGWSKFVNHKKLVAGDSVVFMRNRPKELFVGIKRAERCSKNVDLGRWDCQVSVRRKLDGEFKSREGFSRSSKGRISAESVVQAAELAGAGRPFEIVYYPNVGSPDFVVKAETVENSLNVIWQAGTRFKMAMESEDVSRLAWFHGSVSSTLVPDQGPWLGSPWRMLQVTWDDPAVLQDIKRVSPWQVELIETTPPFPSVKKLRDSYNHEFLISGEGVPIIPTGLANSMMGCMNLFPSNSSPAGMQGARHNTINVSDFSNFFVSNTRQMLNSEHVYGNVVPQLSSVSTELNNVNTSQSDNSSPRSECSVQFSGSGIYNAVTKAGNAIQLFGKIIHVNQPVDAGPDDGSCTEDDAIKQGKETEGMYNLLDTSLSDSDKDPYDTLGDQCNE